MDSRWFSPVVILLWVSTTTWLALDKIMPQLREGDPPTYHNLFTQGADDNYVEWDIYLKERLVGLSISEVKKAEDGHLELRSNLALMSELPLAELLPEMLRRKFLPDLDHLPAKGAELQSQLDVDPQGHLLSMEATFRWGDVKNVLRVNGLVVDNELRLTPRFLSQLSLPEIKLPIASEKQLAESFAPQSRMPGLRLGQAWSLPLFSPLQPDSPVEILQAVVAREEPMFWNGKPWNTLVVEYRKAAGAGGPQEVRAQMWVRADGLVLKQQAALLSSQIVFVRRVKDDQRNP